MRISEMSHEDKQTIIEHLAALRRSIVISVFAILIGAVIAFSYSEELLSLIILPLKQLDQRLIVTGITEAFYVKLEMAFIAGFIGAFPVVVLALWNFVKPALYPHERKYVYILFPLVIALFVAGILFAYYGVLRLVLNFLILIAGSNLDPMFKVADYFSFVLWFCLPFGLVFELPVVVWFLAKMGIVNSSFLARNRKYALLVIFILAAALTPGPDPISQTMMAVPVYVLYEISVWVARFANPGQAMDAGSRWLKGRHDEADLDDDDLDDDDDDPETDVIS